MIQAPTPKGKQPDKSDHRSPGAWGTCLVAAPNLARVPERLDPRKPYTQNPVPSREKGVQLIMQFAIGEEAAPVPV